MITWLLIILLFLNAFTSRDWKLSWLLSDKHDLYLLLAKFLGEQYDKVGTLHKK